MFLEDLDHLAGLETPGADTHALGTALHEPAQVHEIGQPAARGDIVRMADLVADVGALPAEVTALRHTGSFVVSADRVPTRLSDAAPFYSMGAESEATDWP